MASIWKHPNSPYFMACFSACIGAGVRQFKLTTGSSDRKVARRIADELEEAAANRRSPEQIRSFLETISDRSVRRSAHLAFDRALRKVSGKGLDAATTRAFTQRWLANTQNEVAPATYARYRQATTALLASLGGKADQDMSVVKREDLAAYRDAEAKRVAPATANLALKIVRQLFNAAEEDGVVLKNEARFVKVLKGQRGRPSERRPFTLDELKRVLALCDPEWRSLVLFGFYTGQRLGDLADLTWQNVDLTAGELRLTTTKTNRPVVLPLAAPLRQHIEALPAGDDPKQPLHPRAFAIMQQQGRVGMLSRQFGEILAAAGLVKARSHRTTEKDRKGRSARRTPSEVSFHCLRHTAVSLLKNAGVSNAVAQDLIGHESAAVSRLYTHIEDATKRAAVDKLPAIG